MSRRFSKLSRSISGSVAIVTGAASGMGQATAYLLADEGAKVALLDINKTALEQVTNEIIESRGDALAIHVDLSSRDAVIQAIEQAAKHFGGIDILINNAGLGSQSDIEGEGFEQSWESSLAVMTAAPAWAIRTALPYLRQASHPRIVNVASTEALGATGKGNTAYTIAKHGVVGLTRSVAVELGPEGITANCICPGPIRTGLTEAIPEEHKTIFAKRRTALRRYGDPEEVAHAILSLVIPAASFVTGATLTVDGGLTIRNA